MIRPLIFNVLFIAVSVSQSNQWPQKFIDAMIDSNGVSISVSIQQKQFTSSSVEAAVIEILKKKHYIMDLPTETIFVLEDTIQTWNKVANQLIIDQLIEGDINIFHLLTGDFKDVTFDRPIEGKKDISMNFNVLDMGYSGHIKIKKSGQPIEVKVIYGKDQSMLILVTGYHKGDLKLYNAFNPLNAEVIDLRE
ncbi:MAG: hypothetical protein CMG10_05120 [Candidatus Marinimicrobia bacterium]|jgi:hypothetical protein|nr:hypothetical protein [Candidatus Neomarinimicrobiota bacterium]|tara:strand:- start:80 stop:658 length:579 start_codon:yes stop_codon:yes gene_type:complete